MNNTTNTAPVFRQRASQERGAYAHSQKPTCPRHSGRDGVHLRSWLSFDDLAQHHRSQLRFLPADPIVRGRTGVHDAVVDPSH